MADDAAPQDPGLDGTGEAEPYQSLYRRFRPQRFSDVRGQEHVTRALLNAVREHKVSHAYLFSGPRGTGKTSTARILAMALNCDAPLDGEPDGTCMSCMAIRRGSSLDVHELDAASNRKLDEMRDLLSRVSLGTSGRWKIYIVDEVHQLTGDAASALLKTLEDPPGHVIFVLATTDPQKVLDTIRSRTQHYEFRLLGPDVLAGLLSDVNNRAALGVAPEAIDLVVRRGHGSARDALSVLDQVAAAGGVDDEMTVVADIVDALADQDAGRVLMAVAECMGGGRDPRRLAVDLLGHLRNGFLASHARGLVQLPDDAAAEVEVQARRLGLAALVRAMEVIGEAATEMRDAVDPRVALEVALVRIASPAADARPAAMLARIEHLERRLAEVEGGPSLPGPSLPGPSLHGPSLHGAEGTPRPVTTTRADEAPPSEASPAEASPVEGRPAEARPAEARAYTSGTPGEEHLPRPVRPAVAPPPSRTAVGDAPPMPRPTLGAHRRATASSAGPPSSLPQGRTGPGPPTTEGPQKPAPSSTPDPVGPSAAATVRLGTSTGTSTSTSNSIPEVGSAASGPLDIGSPTVELPTRDELTKAWGDTVLPSLPARLKAYLALGRFVDVENGAAVYGLPDAHWLSRGQSVHRDFEGALSNHFGRRVPVRLVLDPAQTSSTERSSAAAAEAAEDDPSLYVLADMEDAGTAVMSPEQRLLDAFPGAEEVTP